jgi:hypothetical protein
VHDGNRHHVAAIAQRFRFELGQFQIGRQVGEEPRHPIAASTLLQIREPGVPHPLVPLHIGGEAVQDRRNITTGERLVDRSHRLHVVRHLRASIDTGPLPTGAGD